MIIDKLKDDQHRGSTKRSYHSVWKNFNKFFIQLDVKLKHWEQRLALYVRHLISSNKQSSTVMSYISAIKAVLAMNNIDLNPDQYLLTALMRVCHCVNDKVRMRLPIKKSLLILLLMEIQNIFDSQPFLRVLYTALFSTAYFGLFRVGELTESAHAVRACNIKLALNKKKILFILESSKTHGKNILPQKIKICNSELGEKKTETGKGMANWVSALMNH